MGVVNAERLQDECLLDQSTRDEVAANPWLPLWSRFDIMSTNSDIVSASFSAETWGRTALVHGLEPKFV